MGTRLSGLLASGFRLLVLTAAPASLWLRLLAAVYDLLPLLALWFFATVLALALTGGQLDVRRFADKVLVQALVLASSAAYFAISWSRGGQTIGKSSDDGMKIDDRPVAVSDFLATACLALGVDPMTQNVSNVGRPIRIADPAAKPIREALA